MTDRCLRLEVDSCDSAKLVGDGVLSACPFRTPDELTAEDGRTGNTRVCDHPAATPRPLFQAYGAPPPDWCPLRKSVTMVAGPRPGEDEG